MTNENEMIEVDEMTEGRTDETSGMDDTEGDEFGDEVGGVIHHGEIVTAEEADRALAANHDSVEAFYSSLGEDIATEVRNAAENAKLKMLDAQDSALEAGRILNEVQSRLGHGSFGKWLSLEFGKTDRTARNLMSQANIVDTARQLFGPDGESKILALPATINYDLGADNVPEQAKAEIIERIVTGELGDKNDIREAVREAKAAERKRRRDVEEASGKGKKSSEEGEGEGEAGETFADKKKKYAEAVRRQRAWSLASGMIVREEEDQIDASDIVSLYGEIGSGAKRKMTAEDHVMISEMVFSVAKAYTKGGMEAVEALKPVIPPEPVAKSKKKKGEEGDD